MVIPQFRSIWGTLVLNYLNTRLLRPFILKIAVPHQPLFFWSKPCRHKLTSCGTAMGCWSCRVNKWIWLDKCHINMATISSEKAAPAVYTCEHRDILHENLSSSGSRSTILDTVPVFEQIINKWLQLKINNYDQNGYLQGILNPHTTVECKNCFVAKLFAVKYVQLRTLVL